MGSSAETAGSLRSPETRRSPSCVLNYVHDNVNLKFVLTPAQFQTQPSVNGSDRIQVCVNKIFI